MSEGRRRILNTVSDSHIQRFVPFVNISVAVGGSLCTRGTRNDVDSKPKRPLPNPTDGDDVDLRLERTLLMTYRK